MAGSLLAHLFPRIRGSQEDVATLSLTYLLGQSDILRTAFTKLLTYRLHLAPDASIRYSTQVIGLQKDRPDSKTVVILPAKGKDMPHKAAQSNDLRSVGYCCRGR